ncbi:MAG: T9SS type A sorting domain-containing protein, partial [Syntrophothermus sp.]
AQKGRHTKNGSATEAPGKPVYDGYQYGWQKEQVVLTDFVNDNIKIAFSLKSDQGTRKDGFYFDDFQVRIIDMSINGIPEKTRENSLSIQPNPAKQTTRIQFQVDNPAGVFILTDMKGMVIMKKVLDKEAGEIEIDVKNLSAGMYFCRITTAGGSSVYSKLLVTKE